MQVLRAAYALCSSKGFLLQAGVMLCWAPILLLVHVDRPAAPRAVQTRIFVVKALAVGLFVAGLAARRSSIGASVCSESNHSASGGAPPSMALSRPLWLQVMLGIGLGVNCALLFYWCVLPVAKKLLPAFLS